MAVVLANDNGRATIPYRGWAERCDLHADELVHESLGRIPVSETKIKNHTGVPTVLDVHNYLEEDEPVGPLAFVESRTFQYVTGGVICFNCILIGLEADCDKEVPIFFIVCEQLLLAYFVTEITLRMINAGWAFLNAEVLAGNMIDFAIVLSGVVDMWFLPCLSFLMQSNFSSENAKVIVHMVRMLRIVRLVRLVKMVKPLYILAVGISEAFQGMFWVLIFLVIMLYSAAILATRLIGQHLILPADISEEALNVADMFGNIFESMFVLFELMSCWSMVSFGSAGFDPLFKRHRFLQPLAVLFYIITAWALLAVMTGVVSEKMLAVRDQLQEDEKRQAEARIVKAKNALERLFNKADSDGSKAIEFEEYKAMLIHPDTSYILKTYTALAVEDLEDLFEWMDDNANGELSIDEFMRGFAVLTEDFSQKALLRLQQELARLCRRAGQTMVDKVDESFDAFFDQVKEPITRINVITEQIQRLDLALSGQAARFRTQANLRTSRRDLAAAEARLSAEIDLAMRAVERLDRLVSDGVVVLE